MDEPRAGCSRDYYEFSSDSDEKKCDEWDSDDSLKDRDYVERESEDSSTSSEEQQVCIEGYVAYTLLLKMLAM